MANLTILTAQKKGRFLSVLRQRGNVTQAARAIGVSRQGLYAARAADADFTAAWQDAVDEYVEALEAEADRRAVEGAVTPRFSKGQRLPVEVREYSDVLLMFRLKALRPEKYRERRAVEHTGPQGGPLQVQVVHYADL